MNQSIESWKPVGWFNLPSGKAVVCDPCYMYEECPTRRSALVRHSIDVVKGSWGVQVKQGRDGRNARLLAVSQFVGVEDGPRKKFVFEGAIGVDSGQVGIFDAEHGRDDTPFDAAWFAQFANPFHDDNRWYAGVSNLTLRTPISAGVYEFGAVSESGYGDGCYDLIVTKNYRGEAVKMEVVFIDEEEGDDEPEDMDDDE